MKKIGLLILGMIWGMALGISENLPNLPTSQTGNSDQLQSGMRVLTHRIIQMAGDVDMPIHVEWQGNMAILKSEDQIRSIQFSKQEIESVRSNEISKDLLNKISMALAGRQGAF